jgi:hypothetical protein
MQKEADRQIRRPSMVERVVRRGREPEPEELVYEYIYRWRAERKLASSRGKMVIKGTDVPWEQDR